jgi:hypothetical protein
MVHKVRRQEGRSVILMETRGQRQRDEMEPMPGVALTDPWETATAPASNAGNADAAARPVRLEPAPERHHPAHRRVPAAGRLCQGNVFARRHAGRIVTARVQPAEARCTSMGQQTISKPSAGNISRFCSFSKCE